MTYLILSARDRYSRADAEHKPLAGPSDLFVKEILGDEPFIATDDLRFYPPPGSKVILAGSAAAKAWYGEDVDLNTARGFVRNARMCWTVATYLPIDCIDQTNHEPLLEDEDEDADNDSNSKDGAPTSRQNFRFWFSADCNKLVYDERRTTAVPCLSGSGGTIQQALQKINGCLVLDIETHPDSNTLQCFSFAGLEGPVWTVPVYDQRGNTRFPIVPILRELVKAMQRCVVIGHNITFDLTFLAHFHGVPWGPRWEDTMIQHHRVFPESEKSLGHVISYWINEPYHKDSAGTFHPRNEHQYQTLLRYNAKDVATTRAVYLAQREYASTRPGLLQSFKDGNASLEPYARAGLTGFLFKENLRSTKQDELSAMIHQFTRILHRLVGYPILPTSPTQLADYFFTKLKHRTTVTTPTGAPSTCAKALYDLRLKYPKNVAVLVLLALRDLNKQQDMLGFKSYYREEKR